MTQLRILVLVTFLLPLCHPGVLADTSRADAPYDDWYGQSLVWTIEEYPELRNVPDSRIQWMANTYHRTHSQVHADLERQARAMGLAPLRPRAARDTGPSTIPDSSWDRDVVLDPHYSLVLERAIAKYQGVAHVPEASVAWLARTYNRTTRQVKFDLQRVDWSDPDNMRKEGFPH